MSSKTDISVVCDPCRTSPQTTISELQNRIRQGENRLLDVQQICAACTKTTASEPIECESIDCAWLFERKKAERKAEFLVLLQELIEEVEAEV